jgi:flagellar hook assembly protein FlgD
MTISFTIGDCGAVRLSIYDTAGREVRQLASDITDRGSYSVTWNGYDALEILLSSGTYLCRLTTKEGMKTERLIR